MIGRAVLLCLLTSLAACSSDDGDPTGPALPNAEGRYDGQWTFRFGGDESSDLHCAGYVSITSQSGTSIAGEMHTFDDAVCSDGSSPIAGTISAAGEVELAVPDIEGDMTAEGCSGDAALSGSLAGDSLSLALGPVHCPDQPSAELLFAGTR
jgi:hypothetical protein